MIIENLSTLKIHKLTKEQYQRELDAGRIDENALYLTPDEEVDLSGYATLEQLNTKADSNHNHDDLYYTEQEIDDLIAGVDESISKITSGSTIVAKAEESNHAVNADTATNATNANHATSADTAANADHATNAENAVKATQDASGNVITDTYETKTDASAKLDEAKSYVDTEVAKKADKEHDHDGRYYTETEIDAKLFDVNTSITNITSGTTPVKEADHAASATSATDAEKLGGQLPSYYAKASDIPTGALASKDIVSESDLDDALAQKVNAASEGNHSHLNKDVLDGITDDKVSAWDSAEDNAKAYADNAATNAANTVKNDLLNGAGDAYDTLKELGDLISENVTAIDALEVIASGKADADHTHDIDAEMSEESENPVQNKVIKEYVDTNKTLKNIEEATRVQVTDTAVGFYYYLSNPLPDGWYYYDRYKYSGKRLFMLVINEENTAIDKQADIGAPMLFYISSDEGYVSIYTIQYTGGISSYEYSIADKSLTISEKSYGTARIDYFLKNKVTVPDIAEIGQILKVKSIDENGKPVEWECVDASHNHDDIYYTEAEIDAKLSEHTHTISQIIDLETTLTNASNAILANTNSINAHTGRIETLETKVGDGFEEITSQEIQDLFK